MENNGGYGQDFETSFGGKTLYTDAEYGMLQVEFAGTATVASESRSGSEKDKEFAASVISMAFTRVLGARDAEPGSYKDLPAKAAMLREEVAKELSQYHAELKTFTLSKIEPSESGRKIIELKERQKQFAAMTPEELAKQVEKAQKEAEARLAAMTPEERLQAQENAKRMMEEEAAKREAMLARVREISDALKAAAQPTSTNPSMASAQPTSPNPSVAPAQPKGPNFCPNCGAKAMGYRFCSNCGNRLI